MVKNGFRGFLGLVLVQVGYIDRAHVCEKVHIPVAFCRDLIVFIYRTPNIYVRNLIFFYSFATLDISRYIKVVLSKPWIRPATSLVVYRVKFGVYQTKYILSKPEDCILTPRKEID